MDYHDDDATSINDLPNEVLLLVFKRLSLHDRIINVSQVCDRWSTLVFTDGGTLKLLPRVLALYLDEGMTLLYDEVGRLEIGCQLMMYGPAVPPFLMSPSQFSRWKFSSDSRDPWATIPRMRDQLRTLAISFQCRGIGRSVQGAKNMANLTALLLYKTRLEASDQQALAELGATCPNLRNVSFVSCKMSVHFDLSFLHRGFGRLQRFRLDSYPVCERFLDELLGEHLDTGLRTIVIGNVGVGGNRLVDVLIDRLRNRPVLRVTACGRYFTVAQMRRFFSNITVTEDFKIVYADQRDVVAIIMPKLFIELC